MTRPGHSAADSASPSERGFWFPAGMALLICTVVYIVVWSVRSVAGLERIELKAYDLLLRRQPPDERFKSKFLIVGVGEPEYEKYQN